MVHGSRIEDSISSFASADLTRPHGALASLLDTARVIVLLRDPEGRILYLSRYLQELADVRLDEARGRCWFDLFVSDEDRAAARKAFENASNGHPENGAIRRVQLPSGAHIPVEWHDERLLAPGSIMGAMIPFSRRPAMTV